MHEDAQYLSFFFSDYSKHCWYWEVVECFRKLSLTGVALFFGQQGSLFQGAVALTLLMLFIPTLMKMQPYHLPTDNSVAILNNILLFFVLFTALLLKVRTSFQSTGRFVQGYSETTLGILLIFIVMVVLVVWFVALVHDIREFNNRKSLRYKSRGEVLWYGNFTAKTLLTI